MKWTVAMLIFLLATSARAEIFRDDFNDGDLEGWRFSNIGNDKVCDEGSIKDGELVLTSRCWAEIDGVSLSDFFLGVSVKIVELG